MFIQISKNVNLCHSGFVELFIGMPETTDVKIGECRQNHRGVCKNVACLEAADRHL